LCQDCSSGDYTTSFACSYDTRGNWSAGIKTFIDPTPANSIITDITAVLYPELLRIPFHSSSISFATTFELLRYGTFGCDIFSPLAPTVFLKIGSNVFANADLPSNLPCYCANCVGTFTISANSAGNCGYAGYQHGSINYFQILVGENSICLNSIQLYLNYTMRMFDEFSLVVLSTKSSIQQQLPFLGLSRQH
jgi:hypothetical protein